MKKINRMRTVFQSAGSTDEQYSSWEHADFHYRKGGAS